jgi:EAL domain-containing protein (putative c-di-GMP-specific phosphodiesterase class I)
MSASIGISDSSASGSDVFGLLRSAEAAMRQSKMSGGNRISFFAQELRDRASHELEIEQSLDSALRSSRDQFKMVFQPIVDVATGALRSWEILIRWKHPILGDVPPGVFIPIAENSGLIAAVGDFAIEEALRYLVDAPINTDAREQNVYLSVNVSPLQLTRKGFAADLAAMLHARAIIPSRLCIEVTEGVFTNEEAVAAIGEIRQLGVLVAVDDFGVGYSALSSLQRLPADIVKLDRSFLPQQNAALTSDRSFLAAVVSLAHTVGLKVVMEGIESQAQLDTVVLAGVDSIQGFYIGRPMPSEAAMALACQGIDERSWKQQFDSARRFASGAGLAKPRT